MVARLLRDKGLFEYAEAAQAVHSRFPDARLQLIGPMDPNPTGITSGELEVLLRRGGLEYLGEVADVLPHLESAHVFVLPSYGEGTPRSTLEALAVGRPVITTDVPGCRETVVAGVNGWLVPARNSDALASALMHALCSKHLDQMADRSRGLAESRFDVHSVNLVILTALGLCCQPPPGATPGM